MHPNTIFFFLLCAGILLTISFTISFGFFGFLFGALIVGGGILGWIKGEDNDDYEDNAHRLDPKREEEMRKRKEEYGKKYK